MKKLVKVANQAPQKKKSGWTPRLWDFLSKNVAQERGPFWEKKLLRKIVTQRYTPNVFHISLQKIALNISCRRYLLSHHHLLVSKNELSKAFFLDHQWLIPTIWIFNPLKHPHWQVAKDMELHHHKATKPKSFSSLLLSICLKSIRHTPR